MKTNYYVSPSPVLPETRDDPDWPESPEERCARYEEYYALYWTLRVIQRAQEWVKKDDQRKGTPPRPY